MSLATASPLSSFTASLVYEATNQQVPGSPISPFPHNNISTTRVSSQRGGLYSPSSGSPLALVPDGGSPLLRHLLVCRKRKRDADSTPSPSPGSERSGRDSPRVPNSIIIVKRTAIFTRKEKEEQVVPTTPTSLPEDESGISSMTGIRKLPQVTDNTKLLDLFGKTDEIFASNREE